MAKKTEVASFLRELGNTGFYKKNQGRRTRQLTAIGVAAVICFGAWTLYNGPLLDYQPPIRAGVPLALVVVSGWIIFRLVNYPRFADFLVSVEAEMDKVTWASRSELHRATLVVVGTMFLMGAYLFVCDWLWVIIFRAIHFLDIES